MDNRINNISAQLKNGAIGIVPTDTLYGLIGSAFSKEAVERIYRVKKRDPRKPLIVLIYKLDDLYRFKTNINQSEDRILKKIWPGKVSVILPVKNNKFNYIHRGTEKVAFRMPKSKTIRYILKNTGPLVAPSANTESLPPAENIREAKKYFGDNLDFYLGGKTGSQPSTLIRFNKNKTEIIREGAVNKNAIARIVKISQ